MGNKKSFCGSCLCGSVTFKVAESIKWCAHCHCSLCQKAHGAAFVTWVGVDESRCAIESNGALGWYQSTPEAQRGFCKQCGSTLFFKSSKWPGEIHVVRANFIDDIDRKPSTHAYYASHVDWFNVNDDLKQRN